MSNEFLVNAYHEPQNDNWLLMPDLQRWRLNHSFRAIWRGGLQLQFQTDVASLKASAVSLDDAYRQICQWSRRFPKGSGISVRICADDPEHSVVPAAQLFGRSQAGIVKINHVVDGFWPKIA